MRVDDLGGRVVDIPHDSGNAAVADRDIAGLARGSCAVEEKTAADQDVMTRAQPVTSLELCPWDASLLHSADLAPALEPHGRLRPSSRAKAHRLRSRRNRSTGADEASARMR